MWRSVLDRTMEIIKVWRIRIGLQWCDRRRRDGRCGSSVLNIYGWGAPVPLRLCSWMRSTVLWANIGICDCSVVHRFRASCVLIVWRLCSVRICPSIVRILISHTRIVVPSLRCGGESMGMGRRVRLWLYGAIRGRVRSRLHRVLATTTCTCCRWGVRSIIKSVVVICPRRCTSGVGRCSTRIEYSVIWQVEVYLAREFWIESTNENNIVDERKI